MAGVIVVSDMLVGSVEATAKQFGFGELFVGAIIIGIVGNAAET
jgi:Ca2+:H+ antiporter